MSEGQVGVNSYLSYLFRWVLGPACSHSFVGAK